MADMIDRYVEAYRSVHALLPDATLGEIRRALTDCGIDTPVDLLVEDILAGRESGMFDDD